MIIILSEFYLYISHIHPYSTGFLNTISVKYLSSYHYLLTIFYSYSLFTLYFIDCGDFLVNLSHINTQNYIVDVSQSSKVLRF